MEMQKILKLTYERLDSVSLDLEHDLLEAVGEFGVGFHLMQDAPQEVAKVEVGAGGAQQVGEVVAVV